MGKDIGLVRVGQPFQASHVDAPVELVQGLELSKDQADRGLTTPIKPALDRLRQSIGRMTARRAQSRN